MNAPNIIYILADDMGYGDAGCNNPASKIPTPHLDRLAEQGMRFTDAHAPSSVCTPSRYAVLTGRYCWRSRLKKGVLWPTDGALIEPDRPTVAKCLRDAGYQTACFGKWHLGLDWTFADGASSIPEMAYGVHNKPVRHERMARVDFSKPFRGGPRDCGFDRFFGVDAPNFPPYAWFQDDRLAGVPLEERADEGEVHGGPMVPDWKLGDIMPTLARKTVEFIGEKHEKPFFIYLALTAPHTPIVPNPQFRGISGAGEYGDFVCEVDHAVGQVMAAIDRAGIAGNTLVIFTSDNGPEHFAYGRIREYGHASMGSLRGVKKDTWEGGHRVPFIARWPGAVPAGSTCGQLVSLADFMATAADITGTPLPPGASEDGVSILPLLGGRLDRPVREYAVHHGYSGGFAIRSGCWVYLEAPGGLDAAGVEPAWFREERGYPAPDGRAQLYHLDDDLAESHNRIEEEPAVAARLAAMLGQVRGGPVPFVVEQAGGILSE